MIKMKQELIIEKFNAEENFQKWKDILDLIQNAIIIFGHDKVIYCNESLIDIIHKHGYSSVNIIDDVFSFIIIAELYF